MKTKKTINIKNYCDVLDKELAGMRSRILEIAGEVESLSGKEGELLKSHLGHLRDIANTIDWKLDIMLKACPFDWHQHYKSYESVASVKGLENIGEAEKRVSGGYVGG